MPPCHHPHRQWRHLLTCPLLQPLSLHTFGTPISNAPAELLCRRLRCRRHGAVPAAPRAVLRHAGTLQWRLSNAHSRCLLPQAVLQSTLTMITCHHQRLCAVKSLLPTSRPRLRQACQASKSLPQNARDCTEVVWPGQCPTTVLSSMAWASTARPWHRRTAEQRQAPIVAAGARPCCPGAPASSHALMQLISRMHGRRRPWPGAQPVCRQGSSLAPQLDDTPCHCFPASLACSA